MTGPAPLSPSDHLEVVVDGRQVEAQLTRFPATGNGARQLRWMLRIDGGPVLRGPLTWDGAMVPEVERTAIVTFVRERRAVAARYVAEHGEILRRMSDAGQLGILADALGVSPEDLVSGEPGTQGTA